MPDNDVLTLELEDKVDGVHLDTRRGHRRRTGRTSVWAQAIAIDPSRPAILYAGGDDQPSAAVSKDAGKTWKTIVAGLRHGAEVRALAVAPRTGDVFAALNRITISSRSGLGAYVGDGVYRLKRGGARWTRIAGGLPRRPDGKLAEIRSIAVHPRTGVIRVGTNLGLYGLARAQGAFRWRLLDPAFAGRTVRRIAFAADGSRLYAATPGRFLVSG